MIDPKELRIGNWINEQGLEIQVGMINQSLFDGSEPIPLTEEWLIRFGIKGRPDFAWLNNGFGVQKKDGKYYVAIKDLSGVIFHSIVRVDYVHHLQNIHFDLRGTELTIKE